MALKEFGIIFIIMIALAILILSLIKPSDDQKDFTEDYLEEIIANQAYIIKNMPQEKPQIIVNTTTNTFFKISDEMFLEEARKRYMNNHEWTEETDCSVLTQEFTLIMKELGIEMYKVHVFNDNSVIGHTYNCVPYDVQSGVYNEAWDSYNLVKTMYSLGDY